MVSTRLKIVIYVLLFRKGILMSGVGALSLSSSVRAFLFLISAMGDEGVLVLLLLFGDSSRSGDGKEVEVVLQGSVKDHSNRCPVSRTCSALRESLFCEKQCC